PAAVDVNIHPAKREVKFHREAEVRRLVAQGVRETLLKFHGSETESRKTEARIQTPPAGTSWKSQQNVPATLSLSPAQPPAPPEQPALRMGFAPQPAAPVPTDRPTEGSR